VLVAYEEVDGRGRAEWRSAGREGTLGVDRRLIQHVDRRTQQRSSWKVNRA
jgi:hypothetical protein